MIILGMPDDVDPATVRPTSEWRLSERTERALAERETVIAKVREELSMLTDRALRVRVAQELQDQLDQMGGEPPPGFPNVFAMSRDDMLDFLAEWAGFDPEIEVIYPGAEHAG